MIGSLPASLSQLSTSFNPLCLSPHLLHSLPFQLSVNRTATTSKRTPSRAPLLDWNSHSTDAQCLIRLFIIFGERLRGVPAIEFWKRPDQSVRPVIPDGIEDSSVFLTNATADQSLALALGLAFESLIAALGNFFLFDFLSRASTLQCY